MSPAILCALTAITMIVAIVLMVAGVEEAAILIALVTPIVTTILSVAKLNNVQQEMGEQSVKLNEAAVKLEEVQAEVGELSNGKMTATVKQAVAESITENLPIITPEGGTSNG